MTPSSNSVWGDHKSTLDGCSGPSPCQRSSSPPPAAYAPAREKRETKSFTDWQLQYPCTFGDLSAGRAPACRNPVTGRPPLSKRLHRLIVLLPIPPPPPPDSVGDLSTSQFNVGGKGECAGRMRKPLARIAGRLRSCGTQWPPTFFVWARSVRCVPHVCTSVLLHFTCYAPPPPPDPIIPDATHPTCLSALPTTPVYRSRACRGATVGPSVADLCTLGDLPTCGIFVSCVPPVVP